MVILLIIILNGLVNAQYTYGYEKEAQEKDTAVLVIEIIALIFLSLVCLALLWFFANLWRKWLREFERQ